MISYCQTDGTNLAEAEADFANLAEAEADAEADVSQNCYLRM